MIQDNPDEHGGQTPAEALARAVAALVARHGESELRAAATALSKSYRAGAASSRAIEGPAFAAAYAAVRMPATFAAISEGLRRLKAAAPGFKPKSLLDFGAGPGTATAAAYAAFPEMAEAMLIEPHAPMRAAGHELMAAAPGAFPPATKFGEAQSARLADESADLVIAGYALIELAETGLAAEIDRLYAACRGALLLTEPGTPEGYRRLMIARDRLIAFGAAILAPCPNALACPIAKDDWCHFSVRVGRSRLHKRLKDADAPFEDEPFAYLIAARFKAEPKVMDRIIRAPEATKAGTLFRLCTDGRIEEKRVLKRDKAQFSAIRRLDWGDAFPSDQA